MKKLIFIPAICIAFSCGNQPRKNLPPPTKKADTVKKTVSADTLAAKLKKEDVREKLIGIWADTSGNPLFQIDKKTFFYPDNQGRYAYKFVGDSIQVHYDTGNQSFSWKFKDNDILIMNGHDGLMTLHRVKE